MRRLAILFALLACAGSAPAQTSTINWTSLHQVIDGFGAANWGQPALTSAQQQFFFGTLGFSIYRAAITTGSIYTPGDCSSVSLSCAGSYVTDIQAVAAAGGTVYATPWSPPAIYTTNGSTFCTAGGGMGALATADYALYATWLANFIQSIETYAGVNIAAITPQNEPEGCHGYDSAIWTDTQLDTFIKTNLGPTFTSDSITTKIFMPESGEWGFIPTWADTCMADSVCLAYIAGTSYHDYSAKFYAPLAGGPPYTGGGTPETNPYASDNLKYYMTEVSSSPSAGPNAPGCPVGGWCPTIADAMMYAAMIDDKLASVNANAWIWWAMQGSCPGTGYDNGALFCAGGSPTYPQQTAIRAYVMGQYAKFIRPGYHRIDATHIPQSGVTVSAYKSPTGTSLAIVATNQNASPVTQAFSITNAPTISVLTPWMTTATQLLAQQATIPVSANAFSYSLPAYSVTTFSVTPNGIAPSALSVLQ